MNLQNLPYDTVEVIAQYLSVKDILACSATCSSMRDVFNGDEIWKRKCTAEGFVNINNSEWFVKSNLDLPEVTDDESCLSTLPSCRKCYMMHDRLYQNWREGKFKREEIRISSENKTDPIVMFYKNDYCLLILKDLTKNARLEHRIEVWNVKESPFLHSSFNFNFHDFFEEDRNLRLVLYKIVDDKLIVCKSKLVLIFEISLSSFPAFKLVYSFIIDLSEDQSNSLIARARTEPGFYLSPQDQTRLFETYEGVFICSNFLISNSYISHKLFVWDVLSGKKVAEETFSNDSNVLKIEPICKDKTNKTLIIKLALQGDKYRYHYKGYNLSKVEFDSFDVKHDCDMCVSSNKLVIGAENDELFSYEYETSRCLAVRKCSSQILKVAVLFVGKTLLCGTSDKTILVMNSTLDVLSSHELTFPFFALRPMRKRFVVVYSRHEEEGLWEIGNTAKQLIQFQRASFGDINRYCTKLALKEVNKVTIYNFW